jgi:hypothetical protein
MTCLLNIWGVMLFLRLTWVIGEAGDGHNFPNIFGHSRVARFFLVECTKTVKNILEESKISQMAIKYVYQMAKNIPNGSKL